MSPIDREIRRLIGERGPLSFADFMELCLYGESGYYVGQTLPIGPRGDFVTGSSLSPILARTTASLVERLGDCLQQPADYLEIGYGGGEHLGVVCEALGAKGHGRLLAWDRVRRGVPGKASLLASIEEVIDLEIRGLVFSYELFDAFPVHRLVGRCDGSVGELRVGLDENGLYVWRESELTDPALVSLLGGSELLEGQLADLSPQWVPAYEKLASSLSRGLLVTCDYGFERRRLLDPRVRMHGTLACYTEHRVHRNPLVRLGGQDLTAHVDFTALREAGERFGLETVCLTRQAGWLVAAGLFEQLEDADLRTREEAMTLLDGEGMGHDIRVLVQVRGIDPGSVLEVEALKVLGAGAA